MFIIPSRQDKKWTQLNNSDLKGTVQRSRNMSFDEDSYAKLAKRARSIYAQTGAFTRTSAIAYLDATNEYLVMTQQGMAKVAGTTMAVSDGTGAVNFVGSDSAGLSDLVNWQGYVYSCGPSSNGLRRYNGSGWGTELVDGSQTIAGPLAVEPRQNLLALGQGQYVDAFGTDHVLDFTLNMGSEYYCTSIDSWNGFFVIATRNVNDGKAVVVLWNATSASANQSYFVDTKRIYSVKAYQDTFIIVTSKGKILKFNGGGFDELASFPVAHKDVDWDLQGNLVSSRIIHRGVVVDGEKIYINLSPRIVLPSGDTTGHIFENWFEGGVWCYDPKVGLYHRYSHTSSLRSAETIATSAVDTGTNVITVASAPVSGTPVIYNNAGGTTLAGLTNRGKYYVIYLSATTIKLATTYANALAGTPISLGGTGNSSQQLLFIPNRDFGGSSFGGNLSTTDAGGAICLVANKQNTYRNDAAQVMFGTKLGGTSTTEAYGLAVVTFGQENRGYFITPKLQSSVLTDSWQNVSVKFRGVDSVEDKIIVKYRTIARTDTLTGITSAISQTATWASATQFTSTADLSAAKKGDEVSFHSGSGSGYTAHISTITESGGTYTVTIDETIQNVTATDTVGFVIENWNKIGTVTTDDVDYFTNDNGDRYASDSGLKTFPIGKNAKWIEIKVELRGEDVKIEELLVNGKPFKTFIN